MTPLPLPYRVPLEGTVLIEASAGTGKTYTLERLIARHILWAGHSIDSVLAVTFTHAAAADIKLRLHGFLRRCLDFDERSPDGDIAVLFSGRPENVSEDLLRSRLSAALANFDRAAVYTIHGFCQRLLQDYALDCAQPIPPPALLEDESALRLQVCEEFWRRCGQDPRFSDSLDDVFGSPQRMAGQMAELLSTAALKPDRPVVLHKPEFAVAFDALKTAYRQDGDEALRLLLAAHSDGTLNGNSHKREAIEKCFADLSRFIADDGRSETPDTGKLSSDSLKINKGKQAPKNPFLDALTAWSRHAEAMALYRRECRIFLYHALHDYARTRLSELKSQLGVIGFDDIIDKVYRALAEDAGERLVQNIRNAYPVALVDEFQDTDERQWRIFERLYRGAVPASLTLIGDPKQAIYGFRGGDIHTYLKVQALADHRETLDQNFRSNQALLDGIASVFQARQAQPFPEPGIVFTPITTGRPGETLVLADHRPPALSFFGPGFRQACDITEARLFCAKQCADAIAELLNQGRSGHAVVQSAEGKRPLAAGDIAVLVSKHSEAALIQNQLQQRGVSAVCVSRDELFETYEALDILQVLHAIERPASHHAQVSACSGLLMRSAMAAVAHAPDWQAIALRLADEGPLAAFGDVLDAACKHLLQDRNGGRRMANYLHVLELMQQGFNTSQGPGHYLDWLGRRIALAQNAKTEGAVRPRLESSKPRVRIMTLHQSKGLEFGLVFLPFTAIRASNKSEFARYFDGNRRCLHLDAKHAEADIKKRFTAEQASENLRLLYVGMTRAKFGLRCGWGWVKELAKSSLGHLLLADTPVDHESCAQAVAGFSYVVVSQRTQAHAEEAAMATQTAVPAFQSTPIPWQISSFSSLHRARENTFIRPDNDESDPMPMMGGAPFKGADFGNALHRVLEHAPAADWPAGGASESALRYCRQALVDFGYAPDMAVQGAPILAGLAGHTLMATLPEGICLLDLKSSEKRHELEFHLTLAHADSVEILSVLHANGYCLDRERFGFNQRLNGLLTGKIDLLYRHDGKLFVLDYKSNTLPDYAQDDLRQSIRDSEYDLQYLLYTVAVHRWLRFCMPRYSYSQHFGGVRYLYVRGLDSGRPGSGIYSDRPAEGLILELDRCFGPQGQCHD